MQESQRELILELKQLRQEQGLTYQDIVSQCEAHGEAVSLSTVKRVFAKGSESGFFRSDTTLRPIARVLRGPGGVLGAGEGNDTAGAAEAPRGALKSETDGFIQELTTSLAWYRAALGAARRRERAMVFALVVLSVALYGMIDYFVFPTSLLFRPGL